MYLYEDQFSERHDFPETEKPSKVLIIASTGRSGSHMLGHALHQTGCFGFPLEYVNSANLAEWKRRFKQDDFHSVLNEIQRRRTSPNGVFGIKVHYPHIKQFGGLDGLMKAFPDAYYILLSRKNVLRQAVSLSIASQTGVWISGQEPVGNNPVYDFDNIDRCLRETIKNNASWRYLLSAGGCNYIEMDFDHVCHDISGAVREISDFIGIEVDPERIPDHQVTKRQSESVNEEWASRFIFEYDKFSELLDKERWPLFGKAKGKIMRMMGVK